MAQQENAPNKPVHLMYLCGAVLVFYVLQWTIDWVWGYFRRRCRASSTITLIVGVVAVAGGRRACIAATRIYTSPTRSQAS